MYARYIFLKERIKYHRKNMKIFEYEMDKEIMKPFHSNFETLSNREQLEFFDKDHLIFLQHQYFMHFDELSYYKELLQQLII